MYVRELSPGRQDANIRLEWLARVATVLTTGNGVSLVTADRLMTPAGALVSQ